MRLPPSLVVPLLLALLICLVGCRPTMRHGYARDAHATSEYVLVRTTDSGDRVVRRGIGPESLRMHRYDPFTSNWPSSSRIFFVDLGPECRLEALTDAQRDDTGYWASQDFIQAEAHFVRGKRCELLLDDGTTVSGKVKDGVMVIRPASTTLDVALALDDGTLRVSLSGRWRPERG